MWVEGGRNTAALVDCICDSRVEKKELLLTFSDEAIVAAEWYLPEFLSLVEVFFFMEFPNRRHIRTAWNIAKLQCKLFGGVFGMVPPRLGGCTGAPPLQCGTTFRVNYGKLRKHGVICGIDGGILGKQLEIWWGD